MPDDSREYTLSPDEAALRSSRGWVWLPAALGVLIVLAWTAASQWLPSTTAIDINQHRVNIALPALEGEQQVSQTFTAEHAGLSEIELLLVRHGEEVSVGQILFQLLDEQDVLIARRVIDSGDVVHNQTLRLTFPPIADSLNRDYSLLISGTSGNKASVWAYDLDVYGNGSLELVGGQTQAQDLRFITRYEVLPATAISVVLEMVGENIVLIIVTLSFLLIPGCLLLTLSRRWIGKIDPAAWIGASLGVGAAVWPLIWFWFSLIGGRWRGWSLWLVIIVGWLTLLAVLILRRSRSKRDLVDDSPKKNSEDRDGASDYGSRQAKSVPEKRRRLEWISKPPVKAGLLLLLIVLIGFAVRLLAIRDLAYPAWVDSSRHGLITTLMVESGQFLDTYQPLLPVDTSPYHYGFHSTAASVVLMTSKEIASTLLIIGQLFNALVPLTVYAATMMITRSRAAGVLAAALLAFPFLFPAYYTTWGRYTQLTGMLVLPIAIAITWQVVRGARNWMHLWWLAGLLSAGLFLIHFRVFLFYAVFALVVVVFSLGRHLSRMLAAALIALALTGPRIYELTTSISVRQTFGSVPGYNDFPAGYLRAGWETGFLMVGAVFLMLLFIAFLRRSRWAVFPLVLTLWVGAVFLLVSGRRLGLPETWLVNLNSAYISLFLPLAMILATTAVQIWKWLVNRHWALDISARLVAAALLTAVILFGLAHQVSILNPDTILTQRADKEGLKWLSENAAKDSVTAVNSWRWLSNIWAGSDGGAWIVSESAMNSTTPPVDYTYDDDLRMKVNSYNIDSSEIEDWSDPSSAAWLRDKEVDLIFIGARGGNMDPAKLARNPDLTNIYQRDGVFIFSVDLE